MSYSDLLFYFTSDLYCGIHLGCCMWGECVGELLIAVSLFWEHLTCAAVSSPLPFPSSLLLSPLQLDIGEEAGSSTTCRLSLMQVPDVLLLDSFSHVSLK